MIRAKFIVQQVAKSTFGHSVRLTPVTSGSEENRSFYHHTPGGQIELTVVNAETLAAFGEPGAEFYVDFTPAEEG